MEKHPAGYRRTGPPLSATDGFITRPESAYQEKVRLFRFFSWLAASNPEVIRIGQIQRCHIEAFKEYLRWAPPQHKSNGPGDVLQSATKYHLLAALYYFFVRITEWQWTEAPRRMLVFTGDFPILDQPSPKFMDEISAARFLQAARNQPDLFTRLCCVTLLLTGMRQGEFLLAEWGLSILVETEKISVLLDTGSSISAAHNADALGIDLSKIDKIVLSHGHYDHTGGLRQVLQKMRKDIEIIAHPDIWQVKYVRRKDEPDRYVGIPFQRNELESLGATFNLATKPVRIGEDIMSTGEIPMVTSFEQVDADLFVKEDTGWQQDRLLDDQALIVDMESGLVVILGCAHRGIVNTLYYAVNRGFFLGRECGRVF